MLMKFQKAAILNCVLSEYVLYSEYSGGADSIDKVHIFLEGHKTLQNIHRRFDWHYIRQIYGGDFGKFCGLLKIYELYQEKLVDQLMSLSA